MKDYQQFYQKLSSPFRKHSWLLKGLLWGNKLITAYIYSLYLLALAYLALSWDSRIFLYFFLPALAFFALSFLRKKLNRPRPYEAWEIAPLMAKDTQGSSWPSRHVFSASLISTVICKLWPTFGVLGLTLTVLLAIIRVMAGVHYPRDVLAGLVFGLACGAFSFLF